MEKPAFTGQLTAEMVNKLGSRAAGPQFRLLSGLHISHLATKHVQEVAVHHSLR